MAVQDTLTAAHVEAANVLLEETKIVEQGIKTVNSGAGFSSCAFCADKYNVSSIHRACTNLRREVHLKCGGHYVKQLL